MNKLMTAQRETIQYYKNLLEKEQAGDNNKIKVFLLKRNVKMCEKELSRMMKPKYPIL